MRLILCSAMLILISQNAMAEDYYTGGGYDVKAAEAAELAKKQAEDKEARKQARIASEKRIKAQQEKHRIAMLPENLAKKSDGTVCVMGGKAMQASNHKPDDEAWIRELRRRNLTTTAASKFIQNGTLNFNMNECETLAVMGEPLDRKRTVRASGTTVIYLFPPRIKVTLVDGKVTEWSD